jgi:hypothetical protein
MTLKLKKKGDNDCKTNKRDNDCKINNGEVMFVKLTTER